MSRGLASAERFVGETQPVEHAVAEIVDQHVGLLDQVEQDRLAARGAQIEREAALVAVVGDEMAAIEAAAKIAERIAAFRILDLDHRGAEIGQQHAGERPGDHGGQFDDPYAVEHAAHLSSPS